MDTPNKNGVTMHDIRIKGDSVTIAMMLTVLVKKILEIQPGAIDLHIQMLNDPDFILEERKMIKGLYFKLSPERKRDKFILQFFEYVKSQKMNKVDVLYYLCRMNSAAETLVKIKKDSELGATLIKED